MAKETILAIAAHNDDHTIGAGGVLTKYAKEGKRVITIICSYGVSSHPHLKPEVIKKTRVEESEKADELMGGSGVVYLGLREAKFDEDFKKPAIAKKLRGILKKERPSLVFTHDVNDAHPDHRAVYRMVMRLIKDGEIDCPVYSFDIWSLLKVRGRNTPRMVVDISDTFNVKVKAFLIHESQTAAIAMLLWKMMLKDWLAGILYGYKYAEVFYRLA